MKIDRMPWIKVTALVISASMIVVALPALMAGPASAATLMITVTTSGFVPMNLTIKVGDTITFANADTVVHEVLFKSTTGFTCTATPLVVQPAKAQSCTWTVAGSYAYSDPNQRDKNFRGTVKIDPVAPVVVPTLSLASSTSVVKYGEQTTLSGKALPNVAGTTIDILAQETGETAFTKVTSVVTTNGGTYTAVVTSEIATNYRAELASGSGRVASPVVAVAVRPAVSLVLRTVKGSHAYFTVKVTSSITYTDKYVRVQRKNSLGGWTTLKRAVLGTFSSVRFNVSVPNGTSRMRALLPSSQSGTGYLSSTSRTVTLSR